jgi:hypothetical protein
MKKTKLKSLEKGVNVQVNIDNSRKPIARRTPSKATNIQPMVNFPSYQPARIQQLEPKQQFNNADLSKTMDEYQKQFKTYLETKDKDVKEMIEKFDDTLKKNIAPQKKEESKPGASNVLADNEGTVVMEQPIVKGHTSWDKPNELKENNMMKVTAEPFYTNPLFVNVNPPNIEEELKQDVINARPATEEELGELAQIEIKKQKKKEADAARYKLKQEIEENNEIINKKIEVINKEIEELEKKKKRSKTEKNKTDLANQINEKEVERNILSSQIQMIKKNKKATDIDI